MEPRRSLVPVFCGRVVDAQSEARPPCHLLECIISTVGKHHGQRSTVHPYLTMIMFPTNTPHQLTIAILHHPTCSCLDDSISHTLV